MRWTNSGGPIYTSRLIYSSSEVPISRINNQGVVKRISRIADSPTDPDAEGSDKLDGEKVEVVNQSIGNLSSASPTQPSSKKLHSQIIPITPRTFQPIHLLPGPP
ncbi:hypothetical protein O181_036630 [Austropuccinia psidii MF-1]|uniref:Uncharacterized protein n=1 Tax=Austropuccinia psidii MF-1 TaxID=1389203 RepID=A0A9Q3HCC8_9BASI|nr:hypothetical protein [Austropuccinia psidii MF-1]